MARSALAPGPATIAPGELEARARELLTRRGALFFSEIARELGGFPADVLEALWSLVWSGEASNDAFEPLRQRVGGQAARAPSRRDRLLGRARPRSPAWGAGPAGSGGDTGYRRYADTHSRPRRAW
jgi:ATP-dependent Lhr-like helicase